jgi:hypothetical protein
MIDLYIYTPAQLRLTADHYGVSGFLKDLLSYTRFSSPSIPLARIIDPGCDISPLTRIRNALSAENLESNRVRDHLHYELQILVNTVRSETRGILSLYREIVKQNGIGLDMNRRIAATLEEIDRFLESFRALHEEFITYHVDSFLRRVLCWADEAISIYVEKVVFGIYHLSQGKAAMEETTAALKQRLAREEEYRRRAGYDMSLVDPKDPISGEHRLYRESTLKKWSQSAMYMTSAVSNTPRRLGHLFASIAAAAAMSFAVIATILADRFFPSYSVPWAFLIVVAYMLKDRIKEIMRGVFVRYLPRFVSDISANLIDKASGKRVGFTRTLVQFPEHREIPESVVNVRDHAKNPFRAILPQENIIHFQKKTVLRSQDLLKNHRRLDAVTGIVRFKLDSWLTEMDDPRSPILFTKQGDLKRLHGRRVYHAHIILRMSRKGDPSATAFYHNTLILDREGIVRVEKN